MYEETKIKFDWKGFLIKLVLLILVIVLIIKLLPYNKKTNSTDSTTTFSNNVVKLKAASNTYFNAENLPVNEGESKSITLEELILLNKVKTLSDEDGKECNGEKSYIKAIKDTTGYKVEVHLECGEEKDTTVQYLGASTTTTTTSTTTTTAKASYSYGNNKTYNTTTSKKYVASQVNKTTVAASNSNKKSYKVSFTTNCDTRIKSVSVLEGNKVSVPATLYKEGYTFVGWYRDGYAFDFNTPITGNMVLGAKWIKNSNNTTTTTTTTTRPTSYYEYNTKYLVSFNSNGGSYVGDQYVEYYDKVVRPSNPTKRNATFIGWYHNGEPFDFSTRIRGSITLTARYSETQTYNTVVYSSGYGVSGLSSFTVSHHLAIPYALKNNNYSNVRIKNVSFNRSLSTSTDLANYNYYHTSTFEEYTYNQYDYRSLNVNNMSNIYYANIYKTSTNIYDRGITWTGYVSKQCSEKFWTNNCAYGILYNVTWEYDVIK